MRVVYHFFLLGSTVYLRSEVKPSYNPGSRHRFTLRSSLFLQPSEGPSDTVSGDPNRGRLKSLDRLSVFFYNG